MNTQSHDLQTALDGIWSALEEIATTLDARTEQRRTVKVTPQGLALELAHTDNGARIRRFLRLPDDGGPVIVHRRNTHWDLSANDAERVRRRFA